MLFAKKYETFDEMNKLYNMHFEAKETKMYLRTHMIMLSWDGYTVPEIGRILDIHPHTVRHWIKQYNERGIDGLYDAEKPVPQPLYSEELENEIADLAFTPPKQLGLPFGRWTCERMAQYLFTKKENSYEFKRFLTRLLFRFKGRKIYLILDNARYHTSREMQAWLAKQEGKIEFVFLPKQSPWLNPIEPVWEDFKNDRIRNRHFTSMRQIISESRGYFKHRKQRAVDKAAA